MERLDFDSLDNTEFEEFCFDLLHELGFVNIDWRKGTGLSTSPADSGRDIEAELERTDVDGTRHLEKWFVDPKHYTKGIPPTALQNLLAWAHAERPSVALFIASNFLSNPSKDFIRDYELNNRPPFRIKVWERPLLQRMTEGKSECLARYLLTGMRGEGEILAAEEEFFDRVWYGRHAMLAEEFMRVASGEKPRLDQPRLTQETAEQALEAGDRVADRYGGPEATLPKDDYEWGVFNGKLSALRWVLGSDWDMLDT